MKSMKKDERLDYAAELIEMMNSKEKSPMRIFESALNILDFGGISPKEFLDYLEAIGR